MRHLTALIAGLTAGATSPGAEPSHILTLRFEPSRKMIAISGSWRPPVQRQAASEWRFFLSPKLGTPALAVSCRGKRLPLESLSSTSKDGDREWRVATARSCAAGAQAVISFRYDTRDQAPQLRVTADGGFAGGGGELWYPQSSFAQRDTAILTLDLPKGLVGIATGTEIRRTIAGSRSITTFRNEVPAKLAFAFGPYREAARATPFPMRVLTRDPRADATAMMSRLAALLPTLDSAFGPPPYRSLALVEVPFDGRVLGTSEYGMIFADPSRTSGAFDAAYWAHEFGHQWWGNAVHVRSGTAGASLLTEGMAQYGALLAIEARSGPEAAALLRRSDRKDSIAAYCLLLAAGKDRPLAAVPTSGPDEALAMHRLVTSKGAILIDQLSRTIGRDRFHSILRGFVAEHMGQAVSWQDLEAAIDRGTGGAYRWWFDQWLRRPGAPNVTARSTVDGSRVSLRLVQKPPFYRLTMPVELAGAWGRRRVAIALDGAEASAVEQAPGRVTSVVFDPDALIPNCPRP
jgi:hypothetical protein